MIPALSSSKLLLVLFPWRNRANPTTHFSVSFNNSTPNAQPIAVAKQVDPFTISYLINSCGFSPYSAKVVSKKVQLKNPSTPDSVVDLLKKYGLSDGDIKKVIRSCPQVLTLNAETNLKPKMEFLLSIGVKEDDLVPVLCRSPDLLGSSLNEWIIPFYDLCKRVLVHDELVVKCLKHVSLAGKEDLEKNVVANFELLKAVGVPESHIQDFLIDYFEQVFSIDSARFSERVNRVISMGFDPSTYTFTEAIRFLPEKSTWERKAQVCRNFGWSDSDISYAFRKKPAFMSISVEKLTAIMDYLLNKMGLHPYSVADAPHVFLRSMKKHIIPRCSVVRVLQLKGLFEDDESNLQSFLISFSNRGFENRCLNRYLEQVPELLDIYEGKVDISELGYGFEENLDTSSK